MTAYASFGTLLQMDDGALNFTTVAGVRDIRGPHIAVTAEDTTNQGSPGAWEEFVAGMKSGGEVTFDILYDPSDATHDGSTGLYYVTINRLLRTFRILMPTSPAKKWQFLGLITSFEPANPLKGVQSSAITIKVSGAPAIS